MSGIQVTEPTTPDSRGQTSRNKLSSRLQFLLAVVINSNDVGCDLVVKDNIWFTGVPYGFPANMYLFRRP